jgi:DeoR/GlpR family transcriptional regulator of sugar metabolism
MEQNINLYKYNRQLLIRKTVEESGQVSVSKLSQICGVSEATIRRDLEELADQRWIRRTHGGAVKIQHAIKEPPIIERMNWNKEIKERIGRKAAELINDGETIFLGSGTSVFYVAKYIPDDQPLTVVTNSIMVINELSNRTNVELIVIGGILRLSELSMVGYIADKTVREFRAHKVYMSFRAVDIRHGFTNDNILEAAVDREILQIAPEVIVVADHTKFNQVSTIFITEVETASILITDIETPLEIIDSFIEKGVVVHQV